MNKVVLLTPKGILAELVHKVPYSRWEVSKINKSVLLTPAWVLAG